jgi:NAD(P)-dependent dehydrogenase (short-subunit alcohol dehydrogenase family)
VSRFTGKVAFITGAGRGQGRSHAVALAAEGACLGLVDLGSSGSVVHPATVTATAEDLRETARLVSEAGGRALSFEADVRDFDALVEAAAQTAEAFGGIDFVVANAGITDGYFTVEELPVSHWNTMIDINLTGVFHTCKATVAHVRRRGPGGAFVLVSSDVGMKPIGGLSHYVAAKIGVRSLAQSLAKELGPEGIRANSLHPGPINTDMTAAMEELNGVSRAELLAGFRDAQVIPQDIEVRDATAALLWLLSDDARYVTAHELVVDAGISKK